MTDVTFVPFQAWLQKLITGLTQQKLAPAITFKPLAELWDKVIEYYAESGSWRESEGKFASLTTSFAGRLSQKQFSILLGVIISNGQNWNAAETPKLLLRMLHNALPADLLTIDARARFYHHIDRYHCIARYDDVLTILQTSAPRSNRLRRPKRNQ